MASLKELKNRISSVKSTQKITKAMQMVAAAKLRRAQEAAESARPYAERMEGVLGSLAASMIGTPGAPALLAGTGSDQTHLLIVATAERGLCGAFNANIAKMARQTAAELTAQGKTVKILCVGRKGATALRREWGDNFIGEIDFQGVRAIGFAQAQEVTEKVLGMFEDGEFDVATLFYAHFKSVISQVSTAQQIIPAQFDASDEAAGPDLKGAVYDYEPDEEAILADLLPRNVSVQILKGLLENAASEQGARMAAMDNATRNAGEMIDKLTITYNRTRQAQITKELIEIISGAEAL
ncbi:MAG: F0F1 ATP synthase subunit gamma [Alphaproteobacteria bacterium]